MCSDPLRLALEALHGVALGGDGRVQHLDGDAPVDGRVVRLVDAAHPALAEHAKDPVLLIDRVSLAEDHQRELGYTTTAQRSVGTCRFAGTTGAAGSAFLRG